MQTKKTFLPASDGPVIFGHRGAALDMPENTLSAFRLCRSRGADGIEIDVEFTSDEVAIILHDDTVERTTDGTGEIGEISFEDARLGKRLFGRASHHEFSLTVSSCDILRDAHLNGFCFSSMSVGLPIRCQPSSR